MNPQELLSALHACGIVLTPTCGYGDMPQERIPTADRPLVFGLHVKAPVAVLTDALRVVIREHKAALLDLVEEYEERAAIAEYCGGVPRAEAEALAWEALGIINGQEIRGRRGCVYPAPRRSYVMKHRQRTRIPDRLRQRKPEPTAGAFRAFVEGIPPMPCCPLHREEQRQLVAAVRCPAGPCLLCGDQGTWRASWPPYQSRPCSAAVQVLTFYDLCGVCRARPEALGQVDTVLRHRHAALWN